MPGQTFLEINQALLRGRGGEKREKKKEKKKIPLNPIKTPLPDSSVMWPVEVVGALQAGAGHSRSRWWHGQAGTPRKLPQWPQLRQRQVQVWLQQRWQQSGHRPRLRCEQPLAPDARCSWLPWLDGCRLLQRPAADYKAREAKFNNEHTPASEHNCSFWLYMAVTW